MPTLKLWFPGGRYHATPWGHHVNEGLIEWPPSPWRLLRALVACGFSSQGWMEIPPLAQQLIRKLAEALPSYQLPEASAAHSRHFMPIGEFKKPEAKKRTNFQFSATTTQRADLYNHFTEDTTLVFDTWANVGDGIMLIHWPCELEDDELTLFSSLSASLGYLGRSESWVEAELVLEREPTPDNFNAYPHRDGVYPGQGYEQISLMTAIPLVEYQAWRQQQEEAVLGPHPLPEGKKKPSEKLMKEREKAIAPYPSDLLSCLTKDTAWWKGHGWSQPPGSRRVLYWRQSDALQIGIAARPKKPDSNSVTMMLVSLTTPSGNRASLPPSTRTLPQAELFHRAVVGRLGKGHKVYCPELTGKDEFGNLLRGYHQHAHTLPVDLDGDGHIDHIIIYADMKLGETAQSSIHQVKRLWAKGVYGDIQVAVVGYGDLDILKRLPDKMKSSIESLLGPSGGARVWESVTPFVPPRFLKEGGKNSLVGQVNAELAARRLPKAELVQVDSTLTRELRNYVRRRSHGHGPQPPVDIGFGLRLVFSEPIAGPLLLGYASHYGLGLFAPAP